MILLFKELGKYWNLNFGIYEEFNYDINPKIDFLQKAFGKKKLSLFAKNRKENGSVKINNENYYIDFVEICNCMNLFLISYLMIFFTQKYF